jgi:hypothetical protein
MLDRATMEQIFSEYFGFPYHPFMTLIQRMLRNVALVRTDFSEEHIASIIKVTRLGKV